MCPLRGHTARMAIAVDVSNRQRLLTVSPRWLTNIVRRCLLAEGVERANIGLTVVDDRAIADVHERWLGIPGPTDVVTFDLSTAGGPSAERVLRGDLIVSAETARRMARTCGWTAHRELAYYVVHGLLHLTGYDDRTPATRRSMRTREKAVMRSCGLPAPPRPGRGERTR